MWFWCFLCHLFSFVFFIHSSFSASCFDAKQPNKWKKRFQALVVKLFGFIFNVWHSFWENWWLVLLPLKYQHCAKIFCCCQRVCFSFHLSNTVHAKATVITYIQVQCFLCLHSLDDNHTMYNDANTKRIFYTHGCCCWHHLCRLCVFVCCIKAHT